MKPRLEITTDAQLRQTWRLDGKVIPYERAQEFVKALMKGTAND